MLSSYNRLHTCAKILSFSLRSPSRYGSMGSSHLNIAPHVKKALEENTPVIALESAIITHGLPFPTNRNTALSIENIIHEEGAIPATIGVIKGVTHVGLSAEQIELLSTENSNVSKISSADFGFAAANQVNGGTTVAGTIVVAQQCGINIFATGGIGGVHMGGENSMDISCDLVTLSRTPICVVSSGCKSILDVGRTLEYLETLGVLVVTYDVESSGMFPGFVTRYSRCVSPHYITTLTSAADVVEAHLERSPTSGGMLLAAPIPAEYEIPHHDIEAAIDAAVEQSRQRGVAGKATTPYILQCVRDTIGRRFTAANTQLVFHNAKVAARLANIIQNRKKPNKTEKEYKAPRHCKEVTIVGGSNVDIGVKLHCDFADTRSIQPRSLESSISVSFGGVGRNLADALSQLSNGTNSVSFLSAVGLDNTGRLMKETCKNMDFSNVATTRFSTAMYASIFSVNGKLEFGSVDMAAHTEITPQYISQFENLIAGSSLIALDANIPDESVCAVLKLAKKYKIPAVIEPTDTKKCATICNKTTVKSVGLPLCWLASPNVHELLTMARELDDSHETIDPNLDWTLTPNLKQLITVSQCLVPQAFEALLITLGKHGVIYYGASSQGHLSRWYSAKPLPQQVEGCSSVSTGNESGAGDCLLAGFLHSYLYHSKDIDLCILTGLRLAHEAMQTNSAVPSNLNALSLNSNSIRDWGVCIKICDV